MKGCEIMSKLKIIRERCNVTRWDLSCKTGIPCRTLDSYEQGLRSIDGAKLITLLKLADALGCKIYDLLEDEELVKLCKKNIV